METINKKENNNRKPEVKTLRVKIRGVRKMKKQMRALRKEAKKLIRLFREADELKKKIL